MDTLRLDFALPLRSFHLELTLDVGQETLALVGPSGAGKTSVLRVVAGLVAPEWGTICCGSETWFDSARGIDRSPEARSVGFLFQDYALFPHMTVEQNVRFAGDGRLLLDRLGIAHLARARPGELSGGERQRAALARALARNPSVLLLDEPLSALDAQTRGRVRGDLRELLADLSLPTLLVTHDYEDAAAMAYRVAVLVGGHIVQQGAPEELIAAPATPFVADFVGSNVLVGTARPGPQGLTEIVLDDGNRVVSTDAGEGRVTVVVHPWEISLARQLPADSMLNHVSGRIASLVPVGNRLRVSVGPLTAEVTAASAARMGLREGETAVASFKATGTRVVRLS